MATIPRTFDEQAVPFFSTTTELSVTPDIVSFQLVISRADGTPLLVRPPQEQSSRIAEIKTSVFFILFWFEVKSFLEVNQSFVANKYFTQPRSARIVGSFFYHSRSLIWSFCEENL